MYDTPWGHRWYTLLVTPIPRIQNFSNWFQAPFLLCHFQIKPWVISWIFAVFWLWIQNLGQKYRVSNIFIRTSMRFHLNINVVRMEQLPVWSQSSADKTGSSGLTVWMPLSYFASNEVSTIPVGQLPYNEMEMSHRNENPTLFLDPLVLRAGLRAKILEIPGSGIPAIPEFFKNTFNWWNIFFHLNI